ncbi:hypothetical protein DYBT9623_01324 [Dyadobacter sp. CECT 9623]|uniref:Uncharacterized protein n=1 Tax=Dyadobacter linearis TaxID=2823330 RepID=A0ABM8UMH3_9BACT|nr:hypothetical protein [Dyadobacter sp. CECT 9623]CAG5068592.1 hypothetical protein DYBT9623_01324 [Dyadobacter sp. CECT 9623]
MDRKIAMVKQQINMKTGDQAADDLDYWLTKTPQERLAAVTFLISQVLEPSQRMDKTFFSQRNMK